MDSSRVFDQHGGNDDDSTTKTHDGSVMMTTNTTGTATTTSNAIGHDGRQEQEQEQEQQEQEQQEQERQGQGQGQELQAPKPVPRLPTNDIVSKKRELRLRQRQQRATAPGVVAVPYNPDDNDNDNDNDDANNANGNTGNVGTNSSRNSDNAGTNRSSDQSQLPVPRLSTNDIVSKKREVRAKQRAAVPGAVSVPHNPNNDNEDNSSSNSNDTNSSHRSSDRPSSTPVPRLPTNDIVSKKREVRAKQRANVPGAVPSYKEDNDDDDNNNGNDNDNDANDDGRHQSSSDQHPKTSLSRVPTNDILPKKQEVRPSQPATVPGAVVGKGSSKPGAFEGDHGKTLSSSVARHEDDSSGKPKSVLRSAGDGTETRLTTTTTIGAASAVTAPPLIHGTSDASASFVGRRAQPHQRPGALNIANGSSSSDRHRHHDTDNNIIYENDHASESHRPNADGGGGFPIAAELSPDATDLARHVEEEITQRLEREVEERLRREREQQVITAAVVVATPNNDADNQSNKNNRRRKKKNRTSVNRDMEDSDEDGYDDDDKTESRKNMIIFALSCIIVIAAVGFALFATGVIGGSDGNGNGTGGQIPTLRPTSPPVLPPVATESPTTSPTDLFSPRYQELVSILGPSVTQDLRVFDDETSPQHQAMDWLANADEFFVPLPSGGAAAAAEGLFNAIPRQLLIERYALAVLYYQTGGNENTWFFQFNFLSTTKSICEWNVAGTHDPLFFLNPGITCDTRPIKLGTASNDEDDGDDEDDGEGNDDIIFVELVTVIDLQFNDLAGVLPRELALLTSLTALEVQDNYLLGGIPAEYFTSWTDLLVFDIHGNGISGPIPTEIGNLQFLSVINAARNGLTVTIPTEIGSLTNLFTFNVRDNSISGQIPSEIGNAASLVSLILDTNRLSGTLPSEIGNLNQLTILSLCDNFDIIGEVPIEWKNLTSLDELFVDFTGIIGNLDPIFCDDSSSSSSSITSSFGNFSSDCLAPDYSGGTGSGSTNPTLGADVICSCCTHCCNAILECIPNIFLKLRKKKRKRIK